MKKAIRFTERELVKLIREPQCDLATAVAIVREYGKLREFEGNREGFIEGCEEYAKRMQARQA